MAVEEDKTQSKEGEYEGVFFWFGDDQGSGRAGNHHPQSKRSRKIDDAVHITIHKRRTAVKILAVCGEGKVDNGKGQSALPAPRNRGAVGVAERSCPSYAKAQRVGGCVVLQADVANGSGAKRRSDLRRAASIGGQGMVGGRVVSGGSGCGEELSAGGGEGRNRSLAARVIRVVGARK